MTADSPRVERVTATSEEAGRRLDTFLLTRLKGVPRAHVYRLIRGGEVRVNSRRVQAGYRLSTGDEVRIPPVRQADARTPLPASRVRADWIQDCVIYEDQDLLVLNKPSGLAVHGGSGISLGAIELLRAVRGPRERLEESLDTVFKKKLNPRHNLDAVEGKLFGIGAESCTVGSHEFYLGYAITRHKLLCLDAGVPHSATGRGQRRWRTRARHLGPAPPAIDAAGGGCFSARRERHDSTR